MMCYVVIAVILLLICLNIQVKKQGFNIAQAQNVIWLFAYILYALNYFNYYDISSIVCVISIFYLVSFNLFYINKRDYSLFFDEGFLQKLTISVVDFKVLRRIVFASMISWILATPLLIKSVPMLRNYGMLTMRWILYGENAFFTGLEMCIISYIIRPIATVSIIYFAEQIAVKNIKIFYSIVVLLNAFILIFLTAGRALLGELIIYVTLVILVIYKTNIIRILNAYKKYIIPGVAILILILAVSARRISRDNGILEEAFIYMFSSLPYLTALIKGGFAAPVYSVCLYTFSFIVQPVVLGMQIIGFNVNNKFDMASITSNLVQIGPDSKMNAIASTLLPFYMDLGVFGPLLFSALLAIFVRYIERNLSFRCDRLSFAKYLFVLNGILLSVQSYSFAGASTFMTWLFILILLH